MNAVGLAARNLRRNKLRVTLTVLAVAVALVAFVLLRAILGAFNAYASTSARDRLLTEHRVGALLPVRYVELIRKVPGAQAVNYGAVVRGVDARNPQARISGVAVEAKTFLDVYDEVEVDPAAHERWLKNRSGALIGDQLAGWLGVKEGDRLTMKSDAGDFELTVEGIYTVKRPTYGRFWLMFHYELYNESAPERMKNRVRRIYTRVNDPGSATAIADAVDEVLADQAIPAETKSLQAEQRAELGSYAIVMRAVNIGSIAILGIVLLILGNTIAMTVRERTREHGVFRALGFGRPYVFTVILTEAGLIGLMAGIIGVGLSVPIIGMVVRPMLQGAGGILAFFSVEPWMWGAAIGAGVAAAMMAALIPAWAASKMVVTQALRHVE